MGDQFAAPVYDPVDTDAYPERPFAEASEGVVSLVPHDEDSRSESVFVEQVVDEYGEVSLKPIQDALDAAGVMVPPHHDYVENPDAVPGYRPPVYDAPVTSGGVPVEETEYDDWTFDQLKAEIDERELDVEVPKSKKAAIKVLTKDDREAVE
jgi:hypothetical protein